MGLSRWLSVKEKAAGTGWIPGSRRSPEKENGNPLQYCLGNFMDRGAWWTTLHEVRKSQAQPSD